MLSLTEIPQVALWLLVPPLLAGGIWYTAKISRDKWAAGRQVLCDAESAFLRVARPLIIQVETEPPKAAWHNSMAGLKPVADRLREVLMGQERALFEEAWRQYYGVNRDLLEPEDIQLPGPTPGMGLDYTRGRRAIIGPLKRMVSVAES